MTAGDADAPSPCLLVFFKEPGGLGLRLFEIRAHVHRVARYQNQIFQMLRRPGHCAVILCQTHVF